MNILLSESYGNKIDTFRLDVEIASVDKTDSNDENVFRQANS